ncbi:MAG: single-stranded DNA-binding protein [Spirulinaceae cyanobacterium SM2_1_0]|nr:single-stranded DNA-binding protein [Spirulinaceae cyanobacterium SM2_1_0]
MNSCVLTAQVVEAPKLRYTQDNQTPVADMFVEFAGGREDDPPSRLRVVGWNNLATEIQEQCQVGDRITIQGRLQMSTIDRPEGFKEKRAELVASRIYRQDGTTSAPATPAPAPDNVVPLPSASRSREDNYEDYAEAPPPKATKSKRKAKAPAPDTPPMPMPPPAPPVDDADLDDIPF